MNSRILDLTLILPCLNEGAHIEPSLRRILTILEDTGLEYEVLLIDDASTDDTRTQIEAFLREPPAGRCRALFHDENRGRGATVQEGIREARGNIVGFIDIDLEIPPENLPVAVELIESDRADVVIANRRFAPAPGKGHRRLASVLYRGLVRTLLETPDLDTECGFKFFRRERVLPVLKETRDPRWFWDTEITILAHDRGLRIASIPVLYTRNPLKRSTVRLVRDGCRQLVALLSFAIRRLRGGPRQ